MDPVYFAVGAFVIVIAHFKMELLIESRSFRVVLGVSVALFVGGLILHFTDVGRYSMSGALLCPLLSLGLFRGLRKPFLKKFRHEPADTFLNFKPGLDPDRVFNVLYFISATLLLMILPFGMQQLAKAGW